MTQRIWLILMRAVKSLKIRTLIGSFLLKANKDLDEKVNTEELCFMTLKIDAEKLTLNFKNNMIVLVNFNASSGKSENLHFDDVLLFV